MKKITFAFVAALLSFTLPAFSHTLNTKCPPVTLIAQQTQFSRAVPAFPWLDHFWALYTVNYTYQETTWNTSFVVHLPQANTNEEALMQGAEYFKNKIVLNEPHYSNRFGVNSCAYTDEEGDPVELGYIIIATNPPTDPN